MSTSFLGHDFLGVDARESALELSRSQCRLGHSHAKMRSMRRAVVGVIALGAAAWAAIVTTSAGSSEQTFRSGTDTVSVYATVSGRDGRLVPDLTKDQFQLLDNGKPVDITIFSSLPQPITMTVMLDMSESMVGRLLWIRGAAERLIDEMRAEDRARLGTFGVEVAISPHLTSDKLLLKRVLHEELWPGGLTPLWFAIDAAMTSMGDQSGRRVILIVTDGSNSNPAGPLPTTIERRAINEEFMIYAVAINGHKLNSKLSDIAAASGGGYVIVDDRDDLRSIFSRVIDELRHQYVLGFTPANLDGKKHSLAVRLAKLGMTARSRSAYAAEVR